MRAASSQFLAAIQSSHRVATQIEVYDTGQLAATLTSVVDGSVTLDVTAAVRGRCDLTIADDGNMGLVPTSAADLLAPYGNEIKISRGITYSNGNSELIALGVFRIDDLQVDESGQGLTLRISGQDRAATMQDARFEDPYTVASGTNVATAIQDVISAVSAYSFSLTATSLTTPQLVANEGDDRWAFAQNLAASIGHLLYFDGDGVVRSVPIAAPGSGTAPASQLVEGDDGLLLSASRRWTRQGTYNRVIVTGENTGQGTPVRGVATDDTPTSPTYYYGRFGRVPLFVSSQFVSTSGQAQDAAEGMLAQQIGSTQTVSFGTVVNPTLEPNDVARITRARAGIDEDHVIDSLTIPLSAQGIMTGSTRAVRTVT